MQVRVILYICGLIPALSAVLVGVLSLDEPPRFKSIKVASAWDVFHDDLIKLFPGQLVDRDFRLLRWGTTAEVLSLQELLEAGDGSRFLIDDSQRAKWQRDQACLPSRVSKQYHAFEYPHREATSAPDGQVTLSQMASPLEINHFVFGGRRNMTREPFRMLVAGGGTGDATITAALGFAALNNAKVVIYHLDQSAASVRTARSRLFKATNAPGFDTSVHQGADALVRFVAGSLLEAPEMAMAGIFGEAQCEGGSGGCAADAIHESVKFDYIQSVGVLHHLGDPLQGLKSLVRLLKPSGGMGIALYGKTGRTGIYDVQQMVRMLQQQRTIRREPGAGDGATKEAVDKDGATKELSDDKLVSQYLLEGLPALNWLRRNTLWHEAALRDDSERMDIMAHPCDQAYSVSGLVQLATRAGLRVSDWPLAGAYALPSAMVQHPVLGPRIERLSKLRRFALAELVHGNMGMHAVYLVPNDRPHAVVGKHQNSDAGADGEGTLKGSKISVQGHDSAGDVPLSGQSKLCRTFPPFAKPLELYTTESQPAALALEKCDLDPGPNGRGGRSTGRWVQTRRASAQSGAQRADEETSQRYMKHRYDLRIHSAHTLSCALSYALSHTHTLV
jgi:SAM-dependent methyltransferase